MKKITRREMLSLHITGYLALLYQAFLVGWFGTTAFYVIGLTNGMVIPAGPVFGHIFMGSFLLALFPGQTFWTIRVPDRHGQLRTVVGPLTEVEHYHGQPQR